MNGDLIGINTSILSRSGGSNGIGFAIPANLVAQFVAQAEQGAETFQRPWAGMAGQPVDADLAASLGLGLPRGLLISGLHPASPFATTGFQVGDVITQVDGLDVNSPSEMVFRMSVAGLGRSVEVTRLRAGESDTVTVALEVAPDDPPSDPVVLDDWAVLPGLTTARINPAMIARFNLPLAAEGVVITDLGPLGRRVGLQVGDVIIAINDREVFTPSDARLALTNPPRRLQMLVLRNGQRVALRFRT